MSALVTGATGLVGHAIATALRRRGAHVRALVRSPRGCEEVRGEPTSCSGGPSPTPAARAELELDFTPLEAGIERTLASLSG